MTNYTLIMRINDSSFYSDQRTITFTPSTDGTSVSISGDTAKGGLVPVIEARSYWKRLRHNGWVTN